MSAPENKDQKHRTGIFPPFEYQVPMPTRRPTPPTTSVPAPPSHPATKEQVKGDTLGRRLRWK